MNKTYIVKENDLTKVASAIRDKGGTTDSLVFPHEFNSAIQSINTQKPEQTKSVTYTANSSYNVTPDSGKVLSDVNVTVKVPNYTPKELNPIGINFISWNGDIVETWTLDELQKATELPTVPPTIDLNDITNIQQIYFAFPCWNTTLDDLKAANCPCNVGVCMDLDSLSEFLELSQLGNFDVVLMTCNAFALVQGKSFTLTSNARITYTTDPNPTWGSNKQSITFSEEGTYWVSIRYGISSSGSIFTGNLIPADTDSGKVIAYVLPMISKSKVQQLTRDIPCSFLVGPMAQGCKSLRSFTYSPQSIWLGVANSFQGSYNLEHICIPPKTYGRFHKYYWDTFVLDDPDCYQQAFYVTDNNSLGSEGIGSYRLQSFMWPRGKKDVNTEKMPALYFNMLGNLKSFSVQFQEFSSAGSGISIPNDTPNKVMAEPATIYIQSAIDSDIVNYPFPVNTSKLFPDKTDSLTFDQFNIYVNSSQLDAYKTADGWKNYADYIHSI